MSKSKSRKDKTDLIVIASLEVFHKLLNKKLTPQQAFMQGKLKIKGKMGLAMKLTLILNATRKVLQKNRSRL
jgi:putative sterol carrier protein